MDKRKTARIQPFVARCLVVDGERRLAGYLTDISPRGAQVTSDEPPPEPGAAVVLEVRLAPVRRCRLPASVRWSDEAPTGHVCGLTFGELTAQDRSLLEDVIDRFRRRAAELS